MAWKGFSSGSLFTRTDTKRTPWGFNSSERISRNLEKWSVRAVAHFSPVSELKVSCEARKKMLSVIGAGLSLRIMAVKVENPRSRCFFGKTYLVKSLPTAIR